MLCLEMAMFKHFPITLSTFILRIIHITHLKSMMYSYFHVSFTILLILIEHFSCLHDRNLQYSSALLNNLVNINDMCIMPDWVEDGALEVRVWVWVLVVDLLCQNCWNSIVNQSVLHCWIHKSVVFKVIGINCILFVQFLYRLGH